MKVVSPFPPVPFDRDNTQTDEDALVELARVAAGNAATHYAFVEGPDEVDQDTPNPCPPAPGTGLQAHDHSGGYFGRPFYKSLYGRFGAEGQFNSTNVSKNGVNWLFFAGSLTDGAKVAAFPQNFVPLAIPVPGCDPVSGAYNWMGVTARTFLDSANTLVAADTLTLRVTNYTTQDEVLFSLDPDGTTEEQFQSNETDSPSTLLKCAPGLVNVVLVDLLVELTGTGSARAVSAHVLDFELGVYANEPVVV